MSEEVEALSIPIPPMPETVVVISAELLALINTMGAQAANLSVIKSDAENEAAAALLKIVTGYEKDVEENASAANKPYYQISQAISAAKAKASKPLASIKANLKLSLTNYIIKKDNERLEAERVAAAKRAQEEAVAKAKRDAEEAELAKLNAARAEAAKAAGAEAPTPMSLAPVAPVVSDVIVVKPAQAAASSVKVARKKVCVINNAADVPREYCVPDLALITRAWERGELIPQFHTFFRVEEVVNVSSK